MKTYELLIDAFDRVKSTVHETTEGLTIDQLTFRPNGTGNSIAWLIWHLTRVQDDHVADLADGEQVWMSGGWDKRFNLPFNASVTGYGQDAEEVASVKVEADLLLRYHDAVCDKTTKYLETIQEDDYKKIVDKSWDPPVTLAVRLISIISDDLQHVGQAAYVKGLL